MATHSSILAWRIPYTEDPGGLQSTRLQRLGHDCRDLACMHACMDVCVRAKLLQSCLTLWLISSYKYNVIEHGTLKRH